jgi:hypothetical protein
MRKVVFLFGMLMMAINSNAQQTINEDDIILINDMDDAVFNQWIKFKNEPNIIYLFLEMNNESDEYVKDFFNGFEIDINEPYEIVKDGKIISKYYYIEYDDGSFNNITLLLNYEMNEVSIGLGSF